MAKKLIIFVAMAILLSACANRFNIPAGGGLTNASLSENMMAVQVGTCGVNQYPNEPCVSVTICTPGTNQCQTINNILVDTGSFGLRIFSSLINVNLNQVTDSSGNSIAECAQFGSGSEWGPVKTASVILGGEPAVTTSIEVVNSNFATVPSDCGSPDISPATSGYNGILGIGLFIQDCGSACTTVANNRTYFSCVGATAGSTCTSATATLAQQVTNPVALLPTDNAGVILSLPAITSGGSTGVVGTLTMGIGTQANNTPQAPMVFPADQFANFQTQYNGTTYTTAFIDSGSNGLFFPASLSPCLSGALGFYCPGIPMNLSATQLGATGAPSKVINFQVSNANNLINTGNTVFNNLGGSSGQGSLLFDWGLPFFLGRTVYVGIENKTSSLGTGPLWAY